MNRKNIWDKWLKFATILGNFQMMLILWVGYFILLMPFSLFFTILKDPLKIKNKPKSNWVKRKKIINISEYLRQQ